MDPTEHLAHLRADAAAVLAAARTEPGAAVPSCPGWDRVALLRHLCVPLGWAAVQAEAGPDDRKGFRDAPRPGEEDDVCDFFARAVDRTVAALEAVDPTTTLPTWAGPRPAAWFHRRMAHEVAVHRWDAAGGAIDPALALDGVDELLAEFGPRVDSARLPANACTIHLHATDADGEWLVQLGPERITSERVHAKGDVAVRGAAADLYLFAWNRVPLDDRFEVFGDRSAAEAWAAVVVF